MIITPFSFSLLYIVGALLCLPVFTLRFLAGFIFGFWWGSLYCVLSATISATIAAFCSRHLSKNYHFEIPSKKIKALFETVTPYHWQSVVLIRYLPIIPFSIANYCFGLTEIRLSIFTLTNLVSLVPITFIYCYLGYASHLSLTGHIYEVIKTLPIVLTSLSCWFLIRFILKKYKTIP